MYTNSCIKCSEKYEDDDPEPYYCNSCNEERKRIAEEIDKKMKNMPSERQGKSSFQEYEEIRKIKGTPFVNIKDLGITL